MEIERLRLLRELRDRGSVAAVAAALGVTASAASQQLTALQRGYAVPLTRKQGRRLALTDAGHALAAASLEVDTALERARDSIDAISRDERRVVRISSFDSAALLLVGPLLERLAGEVLVAFTDADVPREGFAQLTADHDLVIAHRLAHDPPWPADRVHVVPLYTEPLDVLLREGHPLAARPAVAPGDLADEHWVAVHPGYPLAGVLEHWGALAGAPMRVAHRVNDFSVAAAIVRSSDSLAVMPRASAAPLLSGGLTLRPVTGTASVRHVDVLARPDALAHGQVRRALDALLRLGATAA